MKLKHLQGTWREAAESYQRDFVSDVAGWHYSRCRIGDNLSREVILEELQRLYPQVSGLELEPFTVIIRVESAGFLRIKYRSTGTRMGYTYTMEVC